MNLTIGLRLVDLSIICWQCSGVVPSHCCLPEDDSCGSCAACCDAAGCSPDAADMLKWMIISYDNDLPQPHRNPRQ
jgi:hypothetical protein